MATVYNIDDAINFETDRETIFIIANEKEKKDNTTGRYYTVFVNFPTFIKHRNKFDHCHELLIDHVNSKPNKAGRLVFDFDIKYNDVDKKQIPEKFKKKIEATVYIVIDKYYKNIDTNLLIFVWSSCENKNKFSKHLTVKNLCFNNWIEMSKTFYQLFCLIWDENPENSWILSNHLIDFQIVRKNASLRMVGSRKIGGNYLIFDDDNHSLEDSLIRLYRPKDIIAEQIITSKNIKNNVEKILCQNIVEIMPIYHKKHINIKKDNTFKKTTYDDTIYNLAYEICNELCPYVYKIGKIDGNLLMLRRIKKYKCILSNKLHEHENSYLIIKKIRDSINVYYGCYRKCSEIQNIHIGSINEIDKKITFINKDAAPSSLNNKMIVL